MSNEMEVEVFRAGDYGERGNWSEEDLDQLAADYSPDQHEAPVTVDHNQNGPALGWVQNLRRVGKLLLARLTGLDAEFLEKLRGGAFKKRSVEFYRKLETTGKPYMKALTFLGAGAPVVKGLSDPQFSESEESLSIEFSETETAETEEVETQQTENVQPKETNFSQEAENHQDETEESATTTLLEVQPEVSLFCERLFQKGSAPPAWREMGLEKFCAALDDTQPLCFAEEAPPTTARQWFQRFLEQLPAAVPMGEETPHTQSAQANMPENCRNVRFEDGSVKMHAMAMRLSAETPHLSYAEALLMAAQ